MIVINNGQKIVEGKVKDLMESETMKVRFKSNNKSELISFFKSKNMDYSIEDELTTCLMKENQIEPTIIELTQNNISLQEVRQLRTLEELFLKWTK